MFPELAGRFFTSEPRGKPDVNTLRRDCCSSFYSKKLAKCLAYIKNVCWMNEWKNFLTLKFYHEHPVTGSLIFLFLLIFYHLNSTSLNKCLGFAHKSSTQSNLFSLQRCHADISHIRTTPPTLDVHGEVRCLVSHHGNMPSPKMPVYMNKNSKSMVDMALF